MGRKDGRTGGVRDAKTICYGSKRNVSFGEVQERNI